MNSRAVAFVRATARGSQSSLHEVLHNEAHWWRGIKLTGHDLVGTPGEPAGCLAKQNPEGAKQSSDLILELDPNANEHLAGGEQRADLVAGSALDADLLEPTRANDLGQGRFVLGRAAFKVVAHIQVSSRTYTTGAPHSVAI